MSLCPGQDHRKLTVCTVTCPSCGREVEMFSDELRLRCPYCKTMVYQEQMPTCIQWCQAARDCIGPKMYDELTGGKPAAGDPGRFSLRPTQTLSEEHRLILRALEAAEAEAKRLLDSGPVRPERLEKLVDFFRGFADRFHHAKEEDLLFKKMNARGMPTEGSPIGVMLAEHVGFRKHVGEVEKAIPAAASGDAAARKLIAQHLVDYALGLRAHIHKEDEILYPMADQLLTPADEEKLADEFARAESRFAEGYYDRYHRLVVEVSRD